MNKREDLLRALEKARERQANCKKRISESAGEETDWHDNAAYDLANANFQVASVQVEEIEEQLKKIKE